MEVNKQTWWDKEIKEQFNDFKSWVGPPSAESKVIIRKFIIESGYESLIDIGCGICDDYFAYKTEYPTIRWTGVESSSFLYGKTQEKKIPVIPVEAHNTGILDNHSEVAYSRHVLEHQRHYEPILTEMIRIASKMVIHIFFIPPRDKEIINYQAISNLFHNTFVRREMENFIMNNQKVKTLGWLNLTDTEEVLIIELK